MMMDPIADMLTRIRNAQLSKRVEVLIPFSKMKKAIADILSQESYIGKIEVVEGQPVKMLRIELKYQNRQPLIMKIRRESKPGRRVYCQVSDLPRVLNDYGLAILSTSQGIMTNKEARKLGVGGELICTVY